MGLLSSLALYNEERIPHLLYLDTLSILSKVGRCRRSQRVRVIIWDTLFSEFTFSPGLLRLPLTHICHGLLMLMFF